MEVDRLMKKMLLQLNPDPDCKDDDEDGDDIPEEYLAEYVHLDSTLDQLDSCLDALEQKNDDLVQEMQKLLAENKETTAAFKAERLAVESKNVKELDKADSESSTDASCSSTLCAQVDKTQSPDENRKSQGIEPGMDEGLNDQKTLEKGV